MKPQKKHLYRLILLDLLSNTSQAICTGQGSLGVASSIDACQIEEPRVVAMVGDSIYFSTATGLGRYAIMKLGGKCIMKLGGKCIMLADIILNFWRWNASIARVKHYWNML